MTDLIQEREDSTFAFAFPSGSKMDAIDKVRQSKEEDTFIVDNGDIAEKIEHAENSENAEKSNSKIRSNKSKFKHGGESPQNS